jgi:hypothetical protein
MYSGFHTKYALFLLSGSKQNWNVSANFSKNLKCEISRNLSIAYIQVTDQKNGESKSTNLFFIVLDITF